MSSVCNPSDYQDLAVSVSDFICEATSSQTIQVYQYTSNSSTNHYTILTPPPHLCIIQVPHYKYLPWLPMYKRGTVEMLVTLNYMKYIRNISVAMVFQLIGENYILLF